jgi:CubicO group peptidase (beta-lactamase class C family)
MNADSLMASWPQGGAAALWRLDGDAHCEWSWGDTERVRPWASVTKVAVALAVGVEIGWGSHRLDEPAGPEGATLAHLLSHASGLGTEVGSLGATVGTKRIYSNAGYDAIAAHVVRDGDVAQWLSQRVADALGIRWLFDGRASSGLYGSLDALSRLSVAWLRGDCVDPDTYRRLTSPFLPDLSGVTPGWGSFSPNLWGLGPEIKGQKNHWMGSRFSPSSFGHFGRSGSFMLIDPIEKIAVCALSDEPFGPWSQQLWPALLDTLHEAATQS